jgi:hypothetical protein
MRRFFTPALCLAFLAPAIGELLSTSSPPAEFFRLFPLATLVCLYGGGALLVREARVRWGKGWLSLLILGAAYGIFEEGLVCKSFFDPHWPDLGGMADYGRWAGVNWPWAVMLTLFHATISIALPILIIELAFPERRREPWLSRRGLWIVSALFLLIWPLGYFLMTAYRPPQLPYWLAVVAVAALMLVAWRLREPVLPERRPARGGFRFGLVGFVGAGGMLVTGWVLSGAKAPPGVTMAVNAGWTLGCGALLWRMTGGGAAWNDRQRWATAFGTLAFFLLIGPLSMLDPNRTDNRAGMQWVAIGFLLGMVWLGGRIRRRERPRPAGLPRTQEEAGPRCPHS